MVGKSAVVSNLGPELLDLRMGGMNPSCEEYFQ
jgi:hypothetical protein